MSSAYYIVLERKIEGFDEQVNGKPLANAGESLDPLARQAGVQTLMEFFSVVPEEVAGLFEDEGLDLPKLPSEAWFSAEDGLKSVRALLQAADNVQNGITGAVVDDLRQFQKVMETAQANGVRWHLAVDY